MKLLVFLLVLALVAVMSSAVTQLYPRGCIYVNGHCHKGCEEGTHSYGSGCGQKLPEATCDEPNPVKERGNTCDFFGCYCDPPTVRNKEGKCVPLDECPKK